MAMFYTLEFGFPPVEVQTAVVSKIRMLQSQLTALETLQKQSEDNARFILESYLPSSISEHIAVDGAEASGDTISHED